MGGKRISQEEYEEELKYINPNIKLIDTYINKNTKTMHKCLIDGYEWPTYPHTALQGHGCPMCAGVLKLTQEQFVECVSIANPNVEILGTYINANTPVLTRCKVDGHEWLAWPKVLFEGGGCPKCANVRTGLALRKTHEEYVEQLKTRTETIVVKGIYEKDNHSILHECLVCRNYFQSAPSNMLQNPTCPICSGKRIGNPPRYQNSIWASEYYELFSKYMTEDQMKTTMPMSGKKIKMICPDCGKEKKMAPYNVAYHKTISCVCGGGMSYPNKFMISLLRQLDIEFVSEYCDEWTNKKKYDNYIESLSCIIENHGRQHYEKCNFTERTLEEEQANDAYKKDLALSNGISHYIIIDCRHTTMDWIKNSVMNSKLPSLLNFTESDIDWLQCDEFANKNIVKEVCEYYEANRDMLMQDVATHFNISRATLRNYVKIGTKHGWCSYNPQQSFKNKGHLLSGRNGPTTSIIYCVDLHKIFGCQQEAKQHLGLTGSPHISSACAGDRPRAGGYEWKYLYDRTRRNGELVLGAITLGLITEEEALQQLNNKNN